MDFVLPPCLTTRAALTLPAGETADGSDLSRRACKDAAMPIDFAWRCSFFAWRLTLGDACAQRDVTEWRKSPPGRLPSSRPSCEPVLADVRPTSGWRGTRNLCAALRSASLEGGVYQVERPCSHAATPSGPYSYVLDVWGSLSPAPGPRQLRHWAATPDAPDRTATKAWRPHAPSSPSTTTARP